MAKPKNKAYTSYAHEAVELLGILIHNARVAHRMTVAELAERAGISRGLVHRIENGEMGCSIGAVFETAAILGLELFRAEPTTLTRHLTMQKDKLILLPQTVRERRLKIDDDF